jgi:hypothetical protein
MTGSYSEIDYTCPMKRRTGRVSKIWKEDVPNIGKLKKTIGFEPSYDLEGIIQSVIDYFKDIASFRALKNGFEMTSISFKDYPKEPVVLDKLTDKMMRESCFCPSGNGR